MIFETTLSRSPGVPDIGKATGAALLRAGARVVLGDIDGELAEKTAAELAEATGGQVCGCALDVADRDAFAAFLDQTERRLGPFEVENLARRAR